MKNLIVVFSFVLFGTLDVWASGLLSDNTDSFNTDVQLQICESFEAVAAKLGQTIDADRDRDVFLFETKKLDLYKAMIQIRLRIKKNRGELAVKGFGLPSTIFEKAALQGAECEVDSHGDQKIVSCSFVQELSKEQGIRLSKDPSEMKNSLSQVQWDFVNNAIGGNIAGNAVFPDLLSLGPIPERKIKFEVNQHDFALGESTTPGGLVTTELKTKQPSTQLKEAVLEIRVVED